MQVTFDDIRAANNAKNWQKSIDLCQQFLQQDDSKWEIYWWLGHDYKNLKQYDEAEQWFTQLQERFPNMHQGWEGWVNIAEHQQNWQEMEYRAKVFQEKYPDLWHVALWLGVTAKQLGRVQEAEQHFTVLTQKRPTWHRGLEELIKLAQQAANQAKVIELSTQFIQQFPQIAFGYWAKGQAQKNLAQYDLAEQTFAQMRENLPNHHQGWEGKITIAQAQNQWQRVLDLATAFVDKFPHSWLGYWFIGDAHKNLGQYEQAQVAFLELQTRFPAHHRGWEGMVNIAQHQANWQAVICASEDFRLHFPDMWQSYWWAGQAHKNLGQYDLALAQFQELQARFPNSHLGFEGGVQIAQHQQNWTQVITLGQKFIQRFPNLWQGYWLVGQAHKNLGQYDLALANFQEIQTRLPNQHQGWEGVVNIAQHQQDFPAIIQAAQQFQQRFPHLWQGWWWAGHAYKDNFQYEAAEHAFQILIEQFPHMHYGYEGMVNVAEHQQDWATVLQRALIFRQHFPHLWHSYYWEGRAYREQAQYEQAERIYREMMIQFPNNIRGINGLIDVANNQADWQQALNWCEQAIELFPYHLPFYQGKGQALVHLKRLDEAETYFLALEQQFPNEYMPLYGLTRIYYPQRKREKVIMVLQKALLKFPNHQNVVMDLIDAYIHHNEPQDARYIFNHYLANKETPDNQLRLAEIEKIELGNTHYQQKLRALCQQFPDNIKLLATYTSHIFAHKLSSDKEETPEYALQLLAEICQKNSNNQWLKSRLIHGCIRFGQHDLAKQMIQQLPHHKTNSETLKFLAWQAHQNQDFDLEKSYWQRILQQDWYAELLDKGKELRQINSQTIQLKPTDFPLFTVVYNELLRIPDFLRYYRKLGVTHFFFVDNHSTDGSFEFLMQQPDCYVFSSSHSYSEAGSGIAWINYLVHTYAQPEQWCIHADVDELLIYPHCETRSLQDLTNYLNQQGAEVMSSYMLDMYPPNLDEQLAFQVGDNMIEKAPYFYNQYDFNHKIECPYISPVGGIFYYFDVPPFLMVKTGVFKYTEDFYFLCSSHHTTPKKMADISSTYLHFKMLGDFKAKALFESKRKQHAAGGAIYRKYAQMYENAFDEHLDLSTLDKSVKYQNSQQLVELGLIQTSLAWDCYSNVNSG